MAWRFKPSKYKNAAPIVPKFENQIRDLSIGSYHSHGNFIGCSAAFMAFNWDIQGSNLAVLPIDAKGRQSKANISLIYAHSDFVTDFQFSPFDDGLLATGSNDTTIKLWRIPQSGIPASGLSQPEVVLSSQPRRIETVNFHPTADNILATSSATSLVTWDLIKAQELYTYSDHTDEVQSVCWDVSGKLLASQCKDKTLRVIDPRAGKCVAECSSHQGFKDSKVVWISDSQRLFTTGFTSDRSRELILRDMRNLKQHQKQITLDSGSGILIPLYDPETNMCFLAGKGDRNVQFIEITSNDPYIVEGLKYSGDQTKGACLLPKRAMDVMQGEVNRVLQLCDASVVPITWQVPRKSYREYHADLFPDTNGLESSMGPVDWWKGSNAEVSKISLDPKKRPAQNLVIFQDLPLAERVAEKKPAKKNESTHANGINSNSNGNGVKDQSPFTKPKPVPRAKAPEFGNNGTPNNNNSKPISRLSAESSPSPSPRVSVTSNSANSSINSNSANSSDDFDEGLEILRRQSSIRDRKKLFEENIRKSQEVTGSATKSRPTSSIAEEPKEAPKPEPTRKISEEKPKIGQDDTENEDQLDKLDFPQLRKKNVFLSKDNAPNEEKSTPIQPKRPASKAFGRVSKFKHLKGDVILKGRFENLKNLSKTMPAECNFVQANPERIALPLTGPGGKVAVFEVKKAGRIPDGVTPVLINGATVMDFAFDPFDHQRLVCVADDGIVRIWQIPNGGITCPVNEPSAMFSAHQEKIQLVKFHPLAKDILLTAAFDRTVRIWDLNDTQEPKITLVGHTDQLFFAEWSRCGKFVATVCRDGKIRIFEPKSGETSAKVTGGEIVPKKGARIVWALQNQYLIVTGFNKQSERLVSMYRAKDLHEMNTMTLDVSPAILRPFYDEDSTTLFLTGKGDSVVSTYEVSTDPPHFFPLSPYRPAGLHQGMAFLQKNVCDVRAVEFARAFRILDNSIEPVSFTVPRVKTDMFQDDLFPPTRVFWTPTMTAKEWLGGARKEATLISLQPNDMKSLNKPTYSNDNINSANNLSDSTRSSYTDKEKASKIQDSVSKMLNVNSKLEQDEMEGVEEKEWED